MASRLASLWKKRLEATREWFFFLVFATTWQGGYVGSQYNRIFSRTIYMKIKFGSQRRETILFLTTNMAGRDVTSKPAIKRNIYVSTWKPSKPA